MQWRRRHCCTHIAGLLYLLSLLGVVVLLVHRDWLPGLAGSPWWRKHPVDYGGSRPHSTNKATGNQSHQQQHWQWKQNTNNAKGGPSGMLSPGPYPYIINEANKCPEGKPQPFLVLLIATEARQVEARDAIRQTWGNESLAPGLGIIRLFLLGANEGELGRLQQRTLESESLRHHDILQQDFLDTYNNLTIKTLMGMNWVAVHCPRASYVMKTDSDMFVNTDYLIHKLLRPQLNPKKNYFTGYVWWGSEPIRDKNNKWYVSPEQYPGEKYPTFCSGSGYVFSGDLAAKIYRASLSIRRLHLEDVYVGICLDKLLIEPTLPPNKSLFNPWGVPFSSCRYRILITAHGFQPNELLECWHQLHSNSTCTNAWAGINKHFIAVMMIPWAATVFLFVFIYYFCW